MSDVPACVRGLSITAVFVAMLAVIPRITEAGAVEVDLLQSAIRSLDLQRPDLSEVKKGVDAGDHDGAARAWLEHCRKRERPRWYWQRSDRAGIAAFVRREMPEAYAAAMADAAEVMNHRFPHSCSPTVVKRVQLGPNFGFMDNPTGDRQFLFTLHRHVFWEELAVAYALTLDEKYAREWADQLGRWLEQFPLPGSDSKVREHEMWYGLDVGIRAYRWCWAYFAFLDSPAMTADLHARWLAHFVEHGRFLRHYHASPGSNWCTMQMYGLLSAALTFPELKESRDWREYATGKLVEAIRLQVRPDGVQVEQSPSYHVGCISWFAEPMRLGELNGVTWPSDYRGQIEKMCEFALWIMTPDGLLPALSDTDRSVFGRQALAVGAMLSGRADFCAWAEVTARDAWLYGPTAVERLKRLPRSTPDETVRSFKDAGYVVMRSGWDNQAAYAVFDCGPRGHGHGHLDLLNIEIQAFGELLIADPGRWWYDESELRRWMLSTPAHNTISLDGQSHTGFERNDKGEYEPSPLRSQDGWLWVQGRHRAYDRIAGAPLCQRDVFYDGRQTWVLVDRVSSREAHEATVNFQFATDAVRRVRADGVVAGRAGGPQVLLVHETRNSLKPVLEASTLSRVYGQKEPAMRLRLTERKGEVRMVCLAHVFRGERLPEVSVIAREGDRDVVSVSIAGRTATLRLDPLVSATRPVDR